MQYTQRLNQFKRPTVWTILPDALSGTDDKNQTRHIPFASIRRVRLRFEPTRQQPNKYAMHIEGGDFATITNINYRGIADFEDQSAEYTNFVRAFHEAVTASGAEPEFASGSTPGAYLANILMSVFILTVLAGVGFLALTAGILWLVAVKALIILFYIPNLLRLLKKNKPGQYRPDHLPEQHLPS